MAITMNGRTFRTLNDELYLNGQRIVAAHAGGTLVYPEGEGHVAKVSGGFSYVSSHTHNGDADSSPVAPCTVNNHLNISYIGTFYTMPDTDYIFPAFAGEFGWDFEDYERYDRRDPYNSYPNSTSKYPIMEQYGYLYSVDLHNELMPSAPLGTNPTDLNTHRRRNYFTSQIGPVAIDIDLSVPQFCQPLRVNSNRKFGDMTARFTTDFMSRVSGHYEVQANQWQYDQLSDSTYCDIVSNGSDERVRAYISAMGTSMYIEIFASVEVTVQWRYSITRNSSGVSEVVPMSGTETKQGIYGFEGPYIGSSYNAIFPAPTISIEDLY